MDTTTRFRSHGEIFGQAGALECTLSHVHSRRAELQRFWADGGFTEICLVACGSSYWLSLSAAETAKERCAIPAFARTSGDVVMHQRANTPLTASPLYIAPSRSGKTTETLEALTRLRSACPGRLVSITGDPGSPLAAMSDLNISVDCAVEESICQTRSFSSLFIAMLAIIAIWGRDDELSGELERLVAEMPSMLETLEPQIKSLADSIRSAHTFFVLGSGVSYGAACEGAYILIEMAQMRAHFYQTLELRHGPMVVVDGDSVVILLASREEGGYERRVIAEARAKGARAIVVCDNDEACEADAAFSIGRVCRDEVTALFSSAVMQAIAYYLAVARGKNPDSPEGLVPWIDLNA